MKNLAEGQVEISHGQIALFNSSVEDPFSEWSFEHIAQGFVWRHGSVSFFVPESGSYTVALGVKTEFQPVDEHATRAIEVPFDVAREGRIEFGGIAHQHAARVPEGHYTLRFELFLIMSEGDNQGKIQLTLSKFGTREFSIVTPWPGLEHEGCPVTIACPAQ